MKARNIVIVHIILFSMLIAVAIYRIATKPNQPSIFYEDINGTENTALAIIAHDEFVATKSHYSARGISEKRTGDRSNVSGDLKDLDYSESLYAVESFNGIKTLQATKTDSDSLTLDFRTTLLAGNLEIIVLIDDSYYCHVEPSGEQSISIAGIAGKTVVIKIAGESAKFSFYVQRVVK